MNKQHRAVTGWLTSLLLSPGMLFGAAWITLWTGTNLYLNIGFRERLERSITHAIGNRFRISISSIGTGPGLGSVVLRGLTMTTLHGDGSGSRRCISYDRLEIPCDELDLALFSSNSAEASARTVSGGILSRCLDRP